MGELTISVDVGERRSAVPVALIELGADVAVASLAVGDYECGNRVVERKTVDDLHRSLAGGRLWKQIGALRRDPRPAYLVIEGVDLDDGAVSSRQVRGALLKTMDNGLRLIQTSSSEDTALWLFLLARQQARRRATRVARGVGRRPIVVSPVGLLSAIPGIGIACAKDLLMEFGSVSGVAAASEADLCTIRGVGPERAQAIVRALTQASS